MTTFTPWQSLAGGALIGLAVSLVLFTHGRAAGISGLWGGLFKPHDREQSFRLSFFGGLIGAGVLLRLVAPGAFGVAVTASFAVTAVAGLLVGYGTRLGSGCTSGHGVIGISRLEPRSIIATVTFMLTGALAVFALRVLS